MGKQLVMVKVTIAFETALDAVVVWKRLKYEDITTELKRNGFKSTFTTTEMGSRGVTNLDTSGKRVLP